MEKTQSLSSSMSEQDSKIYFMKTKGLIGLVKDYIHDIAYINVYFFREKVYTHDSINMFDGKHMKTCEIVPIRIIIQHNKGHEPLFTDFSDKFKQLFKDTMRITFVMTPSRQLRQAHKVNILRIDPTSKTFKTKFGNDVSYYPTSVIVDTKQVKFLDSLLNEFDTSPNAKYEKDKNNNEKDETYEDSLLSLIH